MTGAQFDSAAQAQLQQHDKFKSYDDQGREIASPPSGGASSTSLRGARAEGAPASSSHYVINQGNGQGDLAASSSTSINVSLQLLDKYGPGHDDSKQAPKTHYSGAPGDEEPKTHDRRIL